MTISHGTPRWAAPNWALMPKGMTLTPKENLLRAIRRENPEWVPNGMEGAVFLYPPYSERPFEAGCDSWGVYWDLQEHVHGGTFPTHGGHTITDIAKWRQQLTVPDVDAMDWSKFTWGWSPVPADLNEINREETLVCGIVECGLFERTWMTMGMENALVAYLTDPDLIGEMIAAVVDFKIAVIERFHEVVDLDLVWITDDWGTQQGLFMPPDVWRRVLKPQTKRLYDCINGLGLLVCQHACGKIESVLGDIVEMGADIWDPCQPCNDLAELKRQYGDRITFRGGIDTQFVLDRPGATLEEVRAEVRKRIDEMACGGGYVAEPSHYVHFDPEILATMNDEIDTYGHSFYRRGARA